MSAPTMVSASVWVSPPPPGRIHVECRNPRRPASRRSPRDTYRSTANMVAAMPSNRPISRAGIGSFSRSKTTSRRLSRRSSASARIMSFRVAKWLKNVRFATSARSQMSSIVEVDTPRSRNSSNAAPRIRSRTSCLRTRGVELTFVEAPLNRRGSGRPVTWMRLVGRSSRTAAAAGLPRAAAVRDDGVAKPRGSASGIAV